MMMANPYYFYILIILYFLVNLYVFSHFWYIRIYRLNNAIFKIVFIAFVLMLPFHLMLSRYTGITFIPIEYVGYFYLVIMFYSALYLLVMDLFKFVLNILRMSNFFIRNYGLFLNAGLVLAIITTIGGYYLGTRLNIVEYSVDIASENHTVDKMTVAVFSDLHLSAISSADSVKKIAELVNSHNVDLVLIPGDIVDAPVSGLRRDFAADFRTVRSRYGVYAVTGNSECQESIGVIREFCRRSGIVLLEDASTVIGGCLVLVGRNDRNYAADREGRKPLFAIMENVEKGLPVVMMDHTPFNIEQASENGISLQISGHTHNGQLFPLQFLAGMIYPLNRGHRRVGTTDIIVTSGVGFYGPPVRTSSPPEVVFITLNFR